MKKIIVLLLLCVLALAEQKVDYEKSWINGMSLEAYKTTYFIPASYYHQRPTSYVSGTTFRNVEVEVQFSVKYKFIDNLFGMGGKYYVAYSQHSFWQLYAKSKPFRENIYNPELFARYKLSGLQSIYLNTLQVGYEHMSNGQFNTNGVTINNHPIGNLSRSIDTLYTLFGFDKENWHGELKFWVPITSLDDNPELMDYMGYSSISISHEYERQIISAKLRGNMFSHKGSVEVSYAFPVGKSVNLYIKGYSGYVDTMIDYTQEVHKVGIGFSFSN